MNKEGQMGVDSNQSFQSDAISTVTPLFFTVIPACFWVRLTCMPFHIAVCGEMFAESTGANQVSENPREGGSQRSKEGREDYKNGGYNEVLEDDGRLKEGFPSFKDSNDRQVAEQ
ncbi:hypothetical protein L596_025038 [Steinernema carpocapsae]|uniref:Uncharacterized protein n=1 Tax=Steinernema carpocapsae TaxID=34508 RepID=A0A4U5M6P0_STECR|nr:hypothetical protein L596_025038 [Steinernema carpocapsae]